MTTGYHHFIITLLSHCGPLGWGLFLGLHVVSLLRWASGWCLTDHFAYFVSLLGWFGRSLLLGDRGDIRDGPLGYTPLFFESKILFLESFDTELCCQII